jgi:catechol 2,3-dioxygenase-like lactoylglutathione lyase family enzyme
MMPEPYFHIGILVKDLDAAIRRFHKVLQISFRAPRVVQVTLDHTAGKNPAELRFTYSLEGPPYYELLEALDTGIFGLQQGEGPHHIGMWASDGRERVKDLQGRGLRPEIVHYSVGGQLVFAYFEPADFLGTRIEVLDSSQRAIHEEWIKKTAGGI